MQRIQSQFADRALEPQIAYDSTHLHPRLDHEVAKRSLRLRRS